MGGDHNVLFTLAIDIIIVVTKLMIMLLYSFIVFFVLQ